MATYFVRMSTGHKGQGAKRRDYIAREKSFSGEKIKQELVATEDFNLPSWAKNGREFFEAADKFERRNGVVFRQLIIALPCELSHEENIKIARNIVQKIVGNTKAGTWAIHSKPAFTTNKENIHMHLMFSDRIQDPNISEKPKELYFRRYNQKNPEKGGYLKDITLNVGHRKNPLMNQIRDRIAEAINEGYAKAGIDIRISGKTLEAQKAEAISENDLDKAKLVDRKPFRHIEQKHWRKMQKIYEESTAIDHSKPIPIQLNNEHWDIFKRVIDFDINTAEELLNRLEYQFKKSKYKANKLKKAAKSALIETEEFITGTDLIKVIKDIETKSNIRINNNTAYVNLYNNIYANKEIRSFMAMNFVTRGRVKKLKKAKNNLESYISKKKHLKNENRLTPNEEHRLNLLIRATQEQIKYLEDQILSIKNKPVAKKRYDYFLARLKKSMTDAREKATKKYEEAKIFKLLKKETQELKSNISNTNEQIPEPKILKLIQEINIKEPQKAIEKIIQIKNLIPEEFQKQKEKAQNQNIKNEEHKKAVQRQDKER